MEERHATRTTEHGERLRGDVSQWEKSETVRGVVRHSLSIGFAFHMEKRPAGISRRAA